MDHTPTTLIRTPDQRLRVFVSSTLQELADERAAVREAITDLRLTPVMFELGARPHPPRDLYRAYLNQSHIFIGIYWQRYGWVAPGETISGLEDEYRLSGARPKLIYIKSPAPEREPRLQELLERIKNDADVSYKSFETSDELRGLVENDLAVLLTERFEMAQQAGADTDEEATQVRRSNLETPRTALVNRVEEMAQLSALLLGEDTSLVTLTGPAGAGKSRLALEVAGAIGDQFADGTFWVDLATLRDWSLVIPTVAQTLDVRDVAGGPPQTERLLVYLGSKQILLVLDNFEHVVEAAPAVANMLAHAPRLKVLVTSRTPLHVRGEQSFPIAPLALPPSELPQTVEQIRQSPAVALFLERAQDLNPNFTLTEENAPLIAEICRRLDGLPLAIELAAARVKILSVGGLLARLEGVQGTRLDLLKGGARDLPARQQTLRTTIDWSYELLDPGAQTLFRRLALFAGGCTLEAVEDICNADDRLGSDVLEELQSLVDMNLLMWREMPVGEPRFRMLGTIHEYARERLAEESNVDELRRRHAEYYLALAESAEPELRSANRGPWLDQLEQEADNLRAALAWSISAEGDRHVGLRLASALTWFWWMRGGFGEGRHWLEMLLTPQAGLTPTREVARALNAAGTMAWAQGEAASARPLAEKSLAISRELGDQGLIADALYGLGIASMNQGELDSARAHFRESAEHYRAVGDEWGEAFALSRLGNVVMMTGDFEQARLRLEESLDMARKVGDPWQIAGVLAGLGGLGLAQGDAAMAQARYEEVVGLFRKVGDHYGLSWTVSNLGFAVLAQGDEERAGALFRESLSLGQEMGNPNATVLYLAGMGAIAALRGQSHASEEPESEFLHAARLFGAAHSMRPELATMWQQFVDKARAQIEPAAWDTAFAEGQAMTVDEALAYASAMDTSAGKQGSKN